MANLVAINPLSYEFSLPSRPHIFFADNRVGYLLNVEFSRFPIHPSSANSSLRKCFLKTSMAKLLSDQWLRCWPSLYQCWRPLSNIRCCFCSSERSCLSTSFHTVKSLCRNVRRKERRWLTCENTQQ